MEKKIRIALIISAVLTIFGGFLKTLYILMFLAELLVVAGCICTFILLVVWLVAVFND